MRTIDRVTERIVPILDDLGLSLYDVEQAGGTLRILVDRPGGASIDLITTATRLISRALDADEVVPGSYTLEVSSPGLERPLRTPDHFRGAVDSQVRIKTVEGHDPRRIDGRLVAADDDVIVVRDDEDVEHRLAPSDIQQARTTFDWGPAPKPKGGAGRSKSPNQKARA
jgi:ribosome maturation factor RimP